MGKKKKGEYQKKSFFSPAEVIKEDNNKLSVFKTERVLTDVA